MVAEFGSRAKVLFICKQLFPYPILAFPRARTMAVEEFLQGFATIWEELKRDQEVNPIAVAMAALAIAKALAPFGVRAGMRGFAMFKRMTGGSDEEVEEIFKQVEKSNPGTSGSPIDTNTAIIPSPLVFRNINFEKLENRKFVP